MGITIKLYPPHDGFASPASKLDNRQVKPSAENALRGSRESVLGFRHAVFACMLNVPKKHATVCAQSNHVWYPSQCSIIKFLDFMKQFFHRSIAMETRSTLACRHAR